MKLGDLLKSSKDFQLNKRIFVNLRWIAILGQFFTISLVKFVFNFDFNFIIHGYFPPPKKSLIFNLASQNKIIRKSSIKLAKNAISLCCDIESPLYTFHAGFTVDPKKLGSRFLRQNIVNKEKSIETFVESVREPLPP